MATATAVMSPASTPPQRVGSPRITSMDIVRGIVMVLMAIDHVRVYSGQPAGGPTAGIFFTRWITNFVAPIFVFLAGTAIFLHARKLPSRAALSVFLLTRGIWLVLLELTFLRIAWTFNLDFAHYLLAGIIWMFGWCMIIMAVLVHAPLIVNVIGGVAIMALHNLMDVYKVPISHWASPGRGPWLMKFLYFSGVVRIGGPNGPPIVILFVIVPWIGAMMAGYAFGPVMLMAPARRRSICLKLGVALTLLFIVLRGINSYGDPSPWRRASAPPPVATQAVRTATTQASRPATPPTAALPGAATPTPAPRPPQRPPTPTLFSFLNAAKYPASLSFLLMTLGPMFILLGLAEGWHGWLANIFTTFGRVPLFFYLLHIPLIHFAACVTSYIREGHVNSWLFANHPMGVGAPPAGYMWSLPLLYLVYAICVILLYFPCKWFANLRARNKAKWLSYL
jgi:uncharacterized membrane protein